MAKQPKKKPVYRSPVSGRFIGKDEWKAWQKARREVTKELAARRRTKRQAQVALGIDRRRKRESLGEVTTRKGTRAQAKTQASRLQAVKAKQRPPPDASASSSVGGNRVRIDTYRFEGLEAESQVRELLRWARDSGVKLATVSLGTGRGKNAAWMGTMYLPPPQALRWLSGWRTRASARPILEAVEEGAAIWWEVELVHNPKRKRKGGAKRETRKAKQQGSGSKKAVRKVQGNRRSPVRKGKASKLQRAGGRKRNILRKRKPLARVRKLRR